MDLKYLMGSMQKAGAHSVLVYIYLVMKCRYLS
jgi:hypothetical protein